MEAVKGNSSKSKTLQNHIKGITILKPGDTLVLITQFLKKKLKITGQQNFYAVLAKIKSLY